MFDPYKNFKTDYLQNGLKVVHSTWNCSWQRIALIINAGAVQDKEGKEGTAHLLEHLLPSSAEKMTLEQIRDFFNLSGGNINLGSTGLKNTWYDFLVPLENLSSAIDIFEDMIFTANISSEMVEQEKKVAVREYCNTCTPLDWEIKKRRAKEMFYGTDFARTYAITGTPEKIRNITLADLQEYHGTCYIPQNMTIVALGGLDRISLLQSLNKTRFGIGKEGIKTNQKNGNVNLFPPLSTRSEMSTSDFQKQKENITDSVKFSTVAKIPDFVPDPDLILLQETLYKVFFNRIRLEKKWDYSPDCRIRNDRQVNEISLISPSLLPEAADYIEEEVEQCLYLATRSEDLFEQERKGWINRLKIDDFYGGRIIENVKDDVINVGKPRTLTEHKKRLETVNFSDILELFKWLTPDRRWTFILKP